MLDARFEIRDARFEMLVSRILDPAPYLNKENTIMTPFHLAIQVRDVAEARDFYGLKLGLPEGRSAEHWIDFNLFGHQLVVHLNPDLGKDGSVQNICNPVDKHSVPVPHFGVVLSLEDWHELSARVQTFITDFIIPPHIRFEGEPGEQATLFFADPSGNCLEFKGFANMDNLFAK
jgi:extradiol dioxygenase family protein